MSSLEAIARWLTIDGDPLVRRFAMAIVAALALAAVIAVFPGFIARARAGRLVAEMPSCPRCRSLLRGADDRLPERCSECGWQVLAARVVYASQKRLRLHRVIAVVMIPALATLWYVFSDRACIAIYVLADRAGAAIPDRDMRELIRTIERGDVDAAAAMSELSRRTRDSNASAKKDALATWALAFAPRAAALPIDYRVHRAPEHGWDEYLRMVFELAESGIIEPDEANAIGQQLNGTPTMILPTRVLRGQVFHFAIDGRCSDAGWRSMSTSSHVTHDYRMPGLVIGTVHAPNVLGPYSFDVDWGRERTPTRVGGGVVGDFTVEVVDGPIVLEEASAEDMANSNPFDAPGTSEYVEFIDGGGRWMIDVDVQTGGDIATIGTWTLVVGDQRIVLDHEDKSIRWTSAVIDALPNGWPDSVTLRFEPAAAPIELEAPILWHRALWPKVQELKLQRVFAAPAGQQAAWARYERVGK